MGKITYSDKEQQTVNQLPETKKFTHLNANHIKTVVNENFHEGEDWDNTENKFPDAGGTGESGSIRKWDRFISFNTGNWEVITDAGSQQVNPGSIFVARIDEPGQTPANWRMI